MTRNEEIAERIQTRRQYLERREPGDWTQERVAEKLTDAGYVMEPDNYGHYERGKYRITAELLEHLAPVLNVTVGWFYGDSPVDDFAEEVIASLSGGRPELSPEAKEHVLRTIRLLQGA